VVDKSVWRRSGGETVEVPHSAFLPELITRSLLLELGGKAEWGIRVPDTTVEEVSGTVLAARLLKQVLVPHSAFLSELITRSLFA
jgi:hypothetical protein